MYDTREAMMTYEAPLYGTSSSNDLVNRCPRDLHGGDAYSASFTDGLVLQRGDRSVARHRS